MNQPKVAIIDLGNIGKAVAKNRVVNSRPVMVASRNKEKSINMARQLGEPAASMSISDTIRNAGIIVLTIWFSEIKEFFYQYDALLEVKIIVDPSNPIAPNSQGGFDKVIGENESAGQINASVLPKGASLVKALGTLGVASLANAVNQKPESAVLFYATDDTTINGVVGQLITNLGFSPFRVGKIDQSIRIEVFCDLHEFGGLGKPVTRTELKQLA
jgi:predicted dinucleotide-binding enzyme